MKTWKLIVAALVVAAGAGEAVAQPDSLWSRTFGGQNDDQCYSLIQTTDGGFAMGGITRSFGAGGYDFWSLRTDSNGGSLWSRTFGGGRNDYCVSLIQTADGGFAMAGYAVSFGAGNRDFCLVRMNANGDSLWSRTFGGGSDEGCYSLIQTADGGFAMAGYTNSIGAGHDDFLLVRTNANGDSLWSRTFGGGSDEGCYSLIQTTDGGFAMAGATYSFGAGNADFWLMRTNADGDSLWSRTYGGDSLDACFSLLQTADGGFALAGYTRSFGAGDYDFWLVRTNAAGDSLWSHTFGGRADDECISLVQTTDGGFALGGATASFGAGHGDFWLVRTSTNGDSLWSRTFGGDSLDFCISLIQTADDGFAIAGYTSSFGAGGDDFWLVKTGPDPLDVGAQGLAPLPQIYSLSALYPNPFNSSTRIGFDVPVAGRIRMDVMDSNGRLWTTLRNGFVGAGRYEAVWDAAGVPAGVYLVRMTSGEVALSRKMAVVR